MNYFMFPRKLLSRACVSFSKNLFISGRSQIGKNHLPRVTGLQGVQTFLVFPRALPGLNQWEAFLSQMSSYVITGLHNTLAPFLAGA